MRGGGVGFDARSSAGGDHGDHDSSSMDTPTAASFDAIRKRAVMPPPTSAHPSSTLHHLASASQERHHPTKQAVFQEDDSNDYGDGSGMLRFLYSRKKAPLRGVQSWKDMKDNVKIAIAEEMMKIWDLDDIEDATEKIWEITKERYKGWRASFSSTYKAYSTYAQRMKHKHEDLDDVECYYLIQYFGSKPFQENACIQVTEVEKGKGRPFLTVEEENTVFQLNYSKTLGIKSYRCHGRGYMAKYPTRNALLKHREEDAARTEVLARQERMQHQQEVEELKEKLEHAVSARERDKEETKKQIEEIRNTNSDDDEEEEYNVKHRNDKEPAGSDSDEDSGDGDGDGNNDGRGGNGDEDDGEDDEDEESDDEDVDNIAMPII
ncbi:rRNA-processing protein EFG1-like [Setaria italica]|uniref:rRNA-processing protein EFG1-like n=1 Tax=Setaria italica TaxID=4555 RepID=UPI000BE5A05F|nr:rRNA-processing protein EFG1-like [Setaria italica]